MKKSKLILGRSFIGTSWPIRFVWTARFRRRRCRCQNIMYVQYCLSLTFVSIAQWRKSRRKVGLPDSQNYDTVYERYGRSGCERVNYKETHRVKKEPSPLRSRSLRFLLSFRLFRVCPFCHVFFKRPNIYFNTPFCVMCVCVSGEQFAAPQCRYTAALLVILRSARTVRCSPCVPRFHEAVM